MYEQANQPYLSLLFTTMLCTAYYGLFRVGEIAWTKSNHAAKVTDVQVASNKNKFMFVLRSSKTHMKESIPQIVKISNQCNKSTNSNSTQNDLQLPCPYELLRRYSAVRPPYHSKDKQFFVLSDHSPVTATLLHKCFKAVLIAENFNADLYQLHGICSGCAGDLLKLGLSMETIKKLGRWKSNVVFKYLKY